MPANEEAVNDAAPQTATADQPAPSIQPAPAEKPQAKKTAPAKKPRTKKTAKTAPKTAAAKTGAPKSVAAKAPTPKPSKAAKPQAKKPAKPAKSAKAGKSPKKAGPASRQTEELLSSQVIFDGPLFRILRDRLIEPSGKETTRDIIRHNGSAVILALDSSKSKKNPWVVMERQYRHATGQFLWELPAGKLEPGESPLEGAQRELEEETGYRARKWKPLVEYFASPGFLGEAMKVFVAEGLTVGNTNWDEDEHIEIRLVKLSDLLKKIDKGEILDGKTLIGVLFYARLLARKRGK